VACARRAITISYDNPILLLIGAATRITVKSAALTSAEQTA
jgi:hypothetical protein